MSSFNRRALLVGGASALASCGFTPLHGERTDDLAQRISLQEAFDPETFAFRERMRRRVGHADDGAVYGLSYRLEMEETAVAIDTASDVTRFRVTATADWRLTRLSDGTAVGDGEVRTNGGYDATAAPFATRAAQKAEREELAQELAELVATRILAFATSD
ncbi:MAG: LPS assembly lipoprotein LptE [Pseudomonadota bacterium]